MRKLLYSILIFPLLLAFVGCNNLLDIKPVNSMINLTNLFLFGLLLMSCLRQQQILIGVLCTKPSFMPIRYWMIFRSVFLPKQKKNCMKL